MAWTSSANLRAQVQRLWDQGVLLRAKLGEEPVFPMALKLKRPGSIELTEHYTLVCQWIRQLQNDAHYYRLEWKNINHRQLGRNQVPVLAWINDLDDALAWLGKRRDSERFNSLVQISLEHFPELQLWLSRYPLRALEQAEHWSKVLAVLTWFQNHPNCGLYLRQLDIPGVDTKFIEQHRGLLGELLDLILPEASLNLEARGTRFFERRYGLREKPIRARMRLLDPTLYIDELNDLELPVKQLSALHLPLRRVFVTENEINFLSFPMHPGSAILFGQGYALDRLADIHWLRDQPLHYWGDIDTHGFAILARLRAHLPHTQSLLMDRDTLLQHRSLWGCEQADKRCLHDLPHLHESEHALYDDLRHDRLETDGQPNHCVRLEQEHVRFAWLQAQLSQLTS
ncbi:DUF3322 domain-containing protein [Pseudomonas sp. GD03855]|nr:DUF3322 domain-containing protein [Pseudomonas sp. GD03856]MDH2264765.1 DUF3322 domain-containing protein [Pseudomonas sp. GD03855]